MANEHKLGNCNEWWAFGFEYPLMSLYGIEACSAYLSHSTGLLYQELILSRSWNSKLHTIDQLLDMVVNQAIQSTKESDYSV